MCVELESRVTVCESKGLLSLSHLKEKVGEKKKKIINEMHKSKNMVILQTVAQHLNFLQESENSTPFSACTVHFEELWEKKIIGKSLRKVLKSL